MSNAKPQNTKIIKREKPDLEKMVDDTLNAPQKPESVIATTIEQPAEQFQEIIEHKVSSSDQAAESAQVTKFVPRNRHATTFRCDVFKTDVQICLKDVGYEHLKPMIEKLTHQHIYRTYNSMGKKLTRTNSSNGHWHEIEVTPMADGSVTVKCGPPMVEQIIVTKAGKQIKKIVQNAIEEELEDGRIRRMVDDHRHELIYIGSEELSPQGVKKELEAQQSLAKTMGIVLNQQMVKDNTPEPLTAADGASVRE